MFSDVARLFATPTRIKVLKFFALQPDERFFARVVATIVGGGKEKVQKEILALTRMGILSSRAGREGTTYQWHKNHPLAHAARTFIEDTTLPSDKMIADQFKKLYGVQAVVIAGHLVGEERSSAEMLIVAKRVNDPRIAAAVKKIEMLTVVPIRFAVMEPKEFIERKEAFDRLIRDVLDFNHLVVLGHV